MANFMSKGLCSEMYDYAVCVYLECFKDACIKESIIVSCSGEREVGGFLQGLPLQLPYTIYHTVPSVQNLRFRTSCAQVQELP